MLKANINNLIKPSTHPENSNACFENINLDLKQHKSSIYLSMCVPSVFQVMPSQFWKLNWVGPWQFTYHLTTLYHPVANLIFLLVGQCQIVTETYQAKATCFYARWLAFWMKWYLLIHLFGKWFELLCWRWEMEHVNIFTKYGSCMRTNVCFCLLSGTASTEQVANQGKRIFKSTNTGLNITFKNFPIVTVPELWIKRKESWSTDKEGKWKWKTFKSKLDDLKKKRIL